MSGMDTPEFEQARADARKLLDRVKAGLMTEDEAVLMLRVLHPAHAAEVQS